MAANSFPKLRTPLSELGRRRRNVHENALAAQVPDLEMVLALLGKLEWFRNWRSSSESAVLQELNTSMPFFAIMAHVML